MDLKAHLRLECWKVAMFFFCHSFVHHVAPLIILSKRRNAENGLLLLSTGMHQENKTIIGQEIRRGMNHSTSFVL